jgi:hypothetical protein
MDLDLTVHREEEGEVTVRLGFHWGHRRRGQGVVVGGDAVSPEAGELEDDD